LPFKTIRDDSIPGCRITKCKQDGKIIGGLKFIPKMVVENHANFSFNFSKWNHVRNSSRAKWNNIFVLDSLKIDFFHLCG
jgi:hypothetical protein